VCMSLSLYVYVSQCVCPSQFACLCVSLYVTLRVLLSLSQCASTHCTQSFSARQVQTELPELSTQSPGPLVCDRDIATHFARPASLAGMKPLIPFGQMSP